MMMFAKYLIIFGLTTWAKMVNIWENMGKNGVENMGKNGAQRCLVFKNWRPGCEESHEDLFLEVTPKEGVHNLCGRKYLQKKLPKNFSSKF